MKKLLRIVVAMMSLQFCHSTAKTFLVFGGKTGWIGQKAVRLLQDMGHTSICAESRLENRESIIREIETYHPDYIINAAGRTGRPNIDWCEDHRPETLRANVLGVLNLVDVAYCYNISVTNFSTGCIYSYDDKHPLGSGIGFTEEEEPNCVGSFYSRTKVMLEKLILEYPNVLNLRVKMPVSDDLYTRSFVGKIIRFKKVINMPNSLCVLEDLLPITIEMTLKGITGNYNFANPGVMSHNEVLELYRECIDPNFTYENFSLEEQSKILKVGRSNCELDVSKLLKIFPNISHIKVSMRALFERTALARK